MTQTYVGLARIVAAAMAKAGVPEKAVAINLDLQEGFPATITFSGFSRLDDDQANAIADELHLKDRETRHWQSSDGTGWCTTIDGRTARTVNVTIYARHEPQPVRGDA